MVSRLRSAASAMVALVSVPTATAAQAAEDNMFAPKFVQSYEDFVPLASGVSYRNVKVGSSADYAAAVGDRVVFDWSGMLYTPISP